MDNAALDSYVRFPSFAWLTGPVFDKELRVSSRHRRNYLLRWAYVMVFMLLVVFVWRNVVPRGSSGVFQASRMAEAGQIIVLVVIWFQFIAAQILAVVMLSTAISDEIYHRTLGLLMTTPVGSLQIVLGKLLSKLLQVVLLLAISLPMLAVARVFGGVPWGLVVYGLSVTLTTAIFYGCLSLFFSIFNRRAHAVIIQTVLAGAVLFALLPVLGVLLFRHVVPDRVLVGTLFYLNPYFGLRMAVSSTLVRAAAFPVIWPVHCGIALGVSALLLALATVFVRQAALRQATGQDGSRSGRRTRNAEGASGGHVRRVVGPPVFWKECRAPLVGRLTIGRIVIALLVTGLLAMVYILCARERTLRTENVQTFFGVTYTFLGMLATVILPATCITVEKESQAWPILLTTTVSNGGILWGKLLGAYRRGLPVWGLLLGHAIASSWLGYIRPIAVLQFSLLVGWLMMFLCGTGLYFSTRFKHTTTAVIANVALAIGIWAVVPVLLALATVMVSGRDELIELYIDMNPVVHAVVIAGATTGDRPPRYNWAQSGLRSTHAAMTWMIFNFVIYAGIGLAFLARAYTLIRRKPV